MLRQPWSCAVTATPSAPHQTAEQAWGQAGRHHTCSHTGRGMRRQAACAAGHKGQVGRRAQTTGIHKLWMRAKSGGLQAQPSRGSSALQRRTSLGAPPAQQEGPSAIRGVPRHASYAHTANTPCLPAAAVQTSERGPSYAAGPGGGRRRPRRAACCAMSSARRAPPRPAAAAAASCCRCCQRRRQCGCEAVAAEASSAAARGDMHAAMATTCRQGSAGVGALSAGVWLPCRLLALPQDAHLTPQVGRCRWYAAEQRGSGGW